MITYADYTLAEIFSNYQSLISNYPIIIYIVVASLLFGIIVLINNPSSTSFVLTLTAWVGSIIGIFAFRKTDMINEITSIFNVHFYENIFFYYWNTIVGLLLMHMVIHNTKKSNLTKFIAMIFFCFSISNLVFSLYISSVVGNDLLMVVGNIAPMIVVGNIIIFIFYLYLFIYKVVEFFKGKK